MILPRNLKNIMGRICEQRRSFNIEAPSKLLRIFQSHIKRIEGKENLIFTRRIERKRSRRKQ